MSLSIEQKLAVNMKVARDMWPEAKVIAKKIPKNDDVIYDESPVLASGLSGVTELDIFDPDKGDLNKAVEFYGIDVVQNSDETWSCGNFDIAVRNESRDIAMQQAVTAASGVSNG